MRWLVGLGLLTLGQFIWWFARPSHIGYAPLFWLVCVSLGFKMLQMLHEWVHYTQVREPIRPAMDAPLRRVDVLTTACPGEPLEMIVATLEAMRAIRYPHTSYLCDEGDDPVLRAACDRLGVVHVTRTDKKNAKAGNINNALRQATGDFCVVLDPDHAPTPDFLDRVMPYFEDEQVGYVQVVQAYGNQADSLVARGAAEQTYHFYGPLMMGMNAYGTAMAIGANCTFRRAALDGIGGHAAGLTEDMHTAMRLHAAGWKSVYAPVVVSRGLVPSTLAAYYGQQLKWARGAFELLFCVYPRLWPRFTWAQRLHYLTLPLYFFAGAVALIDLAVPVAALVLAEFPWYVSLRDLALHAVPVLAVGLIIRTYAQRWLREPHESGLHLVGGFLQIGTWWVYVLGLVYTLLRVRVPYLPTPKQKSQQRNEWLLALPNIVTALLLVAACKYGRVINLTTYTNFMVGLTLLNAGILLMAALMGLHQVLHNFLTDMSAAPFRGLVRLLGWAKTAVGTTATRLVQQAAPQLVAGFAILACATWLLPSGMPSPALPAGGVSPATWARTGGSAVLVGLQLPAAETGSNILGTVLAVSGSGASATPEKLSKPWQAVDVPASNLLADGGLLSQLQALQLLPAQQVPLLSWQLPSAPPDSSYWRQMARLFRQQTQRPLLLRPLLPAGSAASHRRSWRIMVAAFRAEQVRNVYWVWTPPRAGALSEYCPASDALDWLAIELEAGKTAAAYEPVRRQLAAEISLHSKPIMLLTDLAQNQLPLTTASHLALAYPEVKAVVFRPAPTQQGPTQWAAVSRKLAADLEKKLL